MPETKFTSSSRTSYAPRSIIRWIYEILKKGHLPLDIRDISNNKFNSYTNSVTEKFEVNWILETSKSKNPSLVTVLVKTFGIWPLIFGTTYASIELVTHICIPICVGGIISYFESDQVATTLRWLYYNVTGFIILLLVKSFLYSPCTIFLYEHGMKMRIACSRLVFSKSFGLKSSSTFTSLMSNDIKKIDNFLIWASTIWKTPIELFIIIYLTYLEVGVSALHGLLLLLALLPCQIILSGLIEDCDMHLAHATKKRVQFVGEIIKSIKFVKMYVWEKAFARTVQKLRERELNLISRHLYLYSVTNSLDILPRIAAFATFTTYFLMDNTLTAKKVFMISLFYHFVNSSVRQFPTALSEFNNILNSIYRIQEFLLTELNGSQIKDLLQNRIEDENALQTGVILDNVTTKSDRDTKSRLFSINLNLQSGYVYGIFGDYVSALVNTIIGELEPSEGKIEVNGTISYAPKELWLFNDSIRETILFGDEYDDQRYKTVCKICALDRELSLLKRGDQTIVGHSLSVKLKSKINLARAVYRRADIYIFDDPLCTLNDQIGQNIFNDCIQNFLKGKCVVLFTNQPQYLKLADQTIRIAEGYAREIGKFDELIPEKYSSKMNEEETNADVDDSENYNADLDSDKPDIIFIIKKYFQYFQEDNGKFFGIVCALIFVTQIVMSGIDLFVVEWIKLQSDTADTIQFYRSDLIDAEVMLNRKGYVYMYTILISLVGYLRFKRNIKFFEMSIGFSRILHVNLFSSILNATFNFLTQTDTGRIMHTLSNGINNFDVGFPSSFLNFLTLLVEAAFIIIVVVVVYPIFILPSLLIVTIFYVVRQHYIKTFKNIARIEKETNKSLLAHLLGAQQDRAIIRVFRAETQFINKFHKYHDDSLSVTYLKHTMFISFTCVIDCICNLYILVVVITITCQEASDVTASMIGLIIAQILILKELCKRIMRQSIEVELDSGSIPKIFKFWEAEQETQGSAIDILPSTYKWPRYGQITFKNVNSKLDCDITNRFNFEIKSKEKIGIINKSGAEKLSLINLLYRLLESEGSIKIDGFDIQKISLDNLRNILTFIPVKPIIFTGTIRYNLDPTNTKSDSELIKFVHQIDNTINIDLNEPNENLSVTERHVIGLARALLRKNNIVIVEEMAGDLNKQLNKLLGDCTVIIVADGLQSVIHCDRIMILDSGRLGGYDHPYKLLENSNIYFMELLNNYDAGQKNEIINVAKKMYNLL